MRRPGTKRKHVEYKEITSQSGIPLSSSMPSTQIQVKSEDADEMMSIVDGLTEEEKTAILREAILYKFVDTVSSIQNVNRDRHEQPMHFDLTQIATSAAAHYYQNIDFYIADPMQETLRAATAEESNLILVETIGSMANEILLTFHNDYTVDGLDSIEGRRLLIQPGTAVAAIEYLSKLDPEIMTSSIVDVNEANFTFPQWLLDQDDDRFTTILNCLLDKKLVPLNFINKDVDTDNPLFGGDPSTLFYSACLNSHHMADRLLAIDTLRLHRDELVKPANLGSLLHYISCKLGDNDIEKLVLLRFKIQSEKVAWDRVDRVIKKYSSTTQIHECLSKNYLDDELQVSIDWLRQATVPMTYMTVVSNHDEIKRSAVVSNLDVDTKYQRTILKR